MAIRDYRLNSRSLGVSIDCQLVVPAARLLEAMLSGWSLEAVNAPLQAVDMQVGNDDKYIVTSRLVDFEAEHKDLVSAFNEILICLAYLVCYKRQDLSLVHGGAMLAQLPQERVVHTLLLGGHKAGKSTYLARHCHQANIFVSDDLICIDADGQVLGLGFPLRLRRPISEDLIALYGANQLLVGHSLVYIGPKALPVYPAGEVLHVDRVVLLEDYAVNEIPQAQWLAMVEQRLVPIPRPRET
jgi:hypothetical protein